MDNPVSEYLAGTSAAAEALPVPTNPWFELLEDGASIQKQKVPPIVEIVKNIVAEN